MCCGMNVRIGFLIINVVLTVSSTVETEIDRKRIWEELQVLEDGIAKGFSDQWELIQRLRYQGIKRHKGLVAIFRKVQKLSEQMEQLKSERQRCQKEETNTETEIDCKKGFRNVEGHCLYVAMKPAKWIEAEKYCRSVGGFLFDGRNKSAEQVLRTHLKETFANETASRRQFWVGGKYSDGKWQWWKTEEEGLTPIESRSWAPGNPRNTSGSKPYCMSITSEKDYKGVVSFCIVNKKFICAHHLRPSDKTDGK